MNHSIMKDYFVSIWYSDENGGGFIADIPDLKQCSAFGKTPLIALAEVEKEKQQLFGKQPCLALCRD